MRDEEKSTESTFGSVLYTRVDDGINEEKSTDVFDDTVESLRKIAAPTGRYTAECSSYDNQIRLI